MKNIFKTHINIPSNISLKKTPNHVFVIGPKGSVCLDTSFLNELKMASKKSQYSSFFRLLQKAIVGVSLKYVVQLTLIGVGFRLESMDNNFMKLKLGFSHLVYLRIPKHIKVILVKKSFLILECIDEQVLKDFSSKIYACKKPDVYKGKGVRYKNQVINLKEGKKK